MAFQKKQKDGFTLDPDKVYEFELCVTHDKAKPVEKTTGKPFGDHYPPLYIVPNSGISLDEETGKARAWRFIEGQPSIWVDEQPALENMDKKDIAVLLSPLEFKNGKLRVRGIEEMKMKALMVQDCFDGKEKQYQPKNRVYKLLNPDAELTTSLVDAEAEYEAMKRAHETSTEDMLAYAFALGIDTSDQSSTGLKTIRLRFLNEAKTNPANFQKVLANQRARIIYTFREAVEKGIISGTQKKNKLTWAENQAEIMDIFSPHDIHGYLAEKYMAKDKTVTKLFDEVSERLALEAEIK